MEAVQMKIQVSWGLKPRQGKKLASCPNSFIVSHVAWVVYNAVVVEFLGG